MGVVSRVSTSTSSRFDLSWTALSTPNNGGSPITSYFLEWDAGTSGATWTEIVGFSPSQTATTYSVTGGSSGLTVGRLYGFRVSASNIFGWGPVSTVSYLKAAQAPSVSTSVVTSIDPVTGGVVIQWAAPTTNGDSIQSYTINI